MGLMIVVGDIGAPTIKGRNMPAAARTHFLHTAPYQTPAPHSKKGENIDLSRVNQNDPPKKGEKQIRTPKPGRLPAFTRKKQKWPKSENNRT